MAVTRVFPRRQEDPLIQQLLEKARQEAAQSSAIGSPSMYTAAAGGGAGPAFGVLTAQILAGVRSGTAQREAQQRQEISNQAASMLRRAETTGQLGDGVIVNEMGNLLRMGTPTQIDRVNVTDTSSYQNVTPQDLTATQIPLEPTTIRLGPEDDPNFLERAFLGRTLKGQDISNIDQLKVAAGYDPLEYDLSMKELSRKNIKTTFSQPEQSGLLTIDDKGEEKLQEVTLRTKTITEDGAARQIIEIRVPGEDGNFRPIRSNETITGVAGQGDDTETFKAEYIVSSENPKNSVGKITQTKKIVNGEIEFLITPTSGPSTGTTISNIHNPKEFEKFLEGNKIITTQQLSAELGETSIKRGDLVKFVADIREQERGIRKLDNYVVALDKSPQGIERFATRMKSFVKQLATKNNLTEGEVMLQLANGQLQGLLGSSRLEVLGGGVMTEYDAQRVIQYLGGDVDSFQSIQKVKMAMQKLLEEKKSRYNIDLESYNLDRAGLGQKGQVRFKPIQSIFPTLKSNEILAPTEYPRFTEYEIKNMDKGDEVLNTINEVIEQVLSNKPANYQLQDEDLLEYFNAKQIRDIKKRFKELGI